MTKWTPVSEGLPKINGEYLVTVRTIEYVKVGILKYTNDLYKIDEYHFYDMKGIPGWYIFDGRDECFIDVDGVIAWAPLPEPFKEDEKTNNLEKAKKIVKEHYRDALSGIFNSKNIVGDEMETIYEDNELTIDICYNYAYFEVFGLSDVEFEELERYYNSFRRK